ncbi:DUF1206 domain-containing protein [Mycobacterium sp. URHB0044]|uniref:DUF1206 domain-containing protein n=1 Tax=Mycobacterium sp. URHB0044 TaxID=1380386 RepID=UPI000686B7DC|nr:DUF1206 domain-containing protein [Mycobacterium sp. URHB0044]
MTEWFERVARTGFAISGVLHLLIAYIILQLALGGHASSDNADQSGALATLASQTGGAVMLWAAAVALVALGLWRLAETVLGPHPGEGTRENSGARDRIKAFALAVMYFALAVSAARFAMGRGRSTSRENAGMSAQLMQSTWGRILLIVVGLVVIGIGGYHVYKGVSKRFRKDLLVSPGSGITAVGVGGYTAKGLVFIGAGILVLVATLRFDPSKATGIDGAVKTLGAAPFGKFLLIIAALGLAAFGAYSFVRSRYARM